VHLSRGVFWAVLPLVVLVTSSVADAALIGINFIGDKNGAEIGLSTEAGVEPQENWNDLKWWEGDMLINADGNETGVTVSIVTNESSYSTYVPIPGPGDNLLMRGYYHGTGSAWSVILSGLTSEYPSGYDLIVYFDGENCGSGTDWVTAYSLSTGETIYGNDEAEPNGTEWDGQFDEASGATVGNYVRFAELTASSFTLTATPISGDGPINAIQIISVPEPASLALVATGLAAALAARARRSRFRR